MWRFTTGAPIRQQPAVTDKSIFVVAEGRGLFRIDRRTGKEMWRNRNARRFLAVNSKFVYAFDRSGYLLVLDQERGTTLGKMDTGAFVVPITNEFTDRLFLASHNGLIVCLRDHDQRTPLVNKKVADMEAKSGKGKDKGNGKKPKEDKEPKEEKKPKDMDDNKEEKKEDKGE
jgi:hypothetical protein